MSGDEKLAVAMGFIAVIAGFLILNFKANVLSDELARLDRQHDDMYLKVEARRIAGCRE